MELNSALLQDMLEDEYQILETSNGLEAINHLRSNVPAIVLHRVKNTILLFAKQMMLQNIVTEQMQEREDNNSIMVDVLSAIVGFRNDESGAHVRRIRIITEILLKSLLSHHSRYMLTESEIAEISNAAALHDVEKSWCRRKF